MRTAIAGIPLIGKILIAVASLTTLIIALALIAPTINADNQPLSATDIVGTWTPVDGTGTLVFDQDGTLTAEGLSVGPESGATPAFGTFYGSGTWSLWSEEPRRVQTKFTDWGETNLSIDRIKNKGYPLGSTGSGDSLRLWILKNVEDDSHFEFRRAD